VPRGAVGVPRSGYCGNFVIVRLLSVISFPVRVLHLRLNAGLSSNGNSNNDRNNIGSGRIVLVAAVVVVAVVVVVVGAVDIFCSILLRGAIDLI
jgi:hypothetical protein